MNLKIVSRPLLLTFGDDCRNNYQSTILPPSLLGPINTAKSSRTSPLVRKITDHSPSQSSRHFTIRDFFHNFDEGCQLKYEPVLEPVLEPIRKLQTQLEALVTPAPSRQDYRENELKPDQPPITFNLNSYRHHNPSNSHQCNNQDKRLQRISQRLRKFNSLTNLQPQHQPTNLKDQILNRRPGFIRTSKSFKRRNFSLQNFQAKQRHIRQYSIPSFSSQHLLSNKKAHPYNPAQSSQQHLSKIRRELTSIYQHRTLHPQRRLKLS